MGGLGVAKALMGRHADPNAITEGVTGAVILRQVTPVGRGSPPFVLIGQFACPLRLNALGNALKFPGPLSPRCRSPRCLSFRQVIRSAAFQPRPALVFTHALGGDLFRRSHALCCLPRRCLPLMLWRCQ